MKESYLNYGEKLREKLREVDDLDVNFSSDYFNKLEDKIMARIEKSSISELEPNQEDLDKREGKNSKLEKIKSHRLSLLNV